MDDLKHERQRMMNDIKREVAVTRHMTGRDYFDSRVMQAMARVPREKFVPADMQFAAFNNGPLPIGHGQTISQPYIVALMTDLLQLQPEDSVLEIGTGSGYQTAILSTLCDQVYTMELIPALSARAIQRLEKLGYENIKAQAGNGYQGWPEHAPYNGIIVTAAASYIPQALIDQLAQGGKLVIPVGPPDGYQKLVLVQKDQQGKSHTRDILGVAFVPLVDTTT